MSIKFKMAVNSQELRLDFTLKCGQSFRWVEIGPRVWRGVMKSCVWTLRQDESHLYCEVLPSEAVRRSSKRPETLLSQEYEEIVKDYFRLGFSLRDLYEDWSARDETFSRVAPSFPGVRVLDQDPVENVFSFICSSNNNIERAKYIATSAKTIVANGGSDWLRSLRLLDYGSCRGEIRKLAGVGPKVADCICLMSMNHLGSIPVDTHVFQIAARDYLPHLRQKKSVTTAVYEEIACHFRRLFGPFAGWAHSVLFTADLKKFQPKASRTGRKRCLQEVV